MLNIGVDVVIQNENGDILLHRRSDDNCWALPGGWVEQGETPDQAAIREVQEETKVTIDLERLAHVQIRPVGTVHLTYIGKYIDGSIQVSPESVEADYKSVDEITAWHADHKERIEKALQK